MKTLIYTIVIILSVGCGKMKNPSETTTGYQTSGCPRGRYIPTTGMGSMYSEPASGVFVFKSENGCVSDGIISCDGNKFTLNIMSNGKADHVIGCMHIGDYQCFSSFGGRFMTVSCNGPDKPKTDQESNPFNPSKVFVLE